MATEHYVVSPDDEIWISGENPAEEDWWKDATLDSEVSLTNNSDHWRPISDWIPWVDNPGILVVNSIGEGLRRMDVAPGERIWFEIWKVGLD